MDIEKINHKLNRLKKQRDELADKHTGREEQYTYHAGYSLGHLEGRINAIEQFIDEITET